MTSPSPGSLGSAKDLISQDLNPRPFAGSQDLANVVPGQLSQGKPDMPGQPSQAASQVGQAKQVSRCYELLRKITR